MNAHFLLQPEAVGMSGQTTKDAILDQLADVFASVYAVDRALVREGMEARERIGSTAFGRGVAIPHARVPGLRRPVAAFLRLATPADFGAADGRPVDLVFGLLSPDQAGTSHLQALAAISRLMRDERIHGGLVAAAGPQELYGLLANVIDRDAA